MGKKNVSGQQNKNPILVRFWSSGKKEGRVYSKAMGAANSTWKETVYWRQELIPKQSGQYDYYKTVKPVTTSEGLEMLTELSRQEERANREVTDGCQGDFAAVSRAKGPWRLHWCKWGREEGNKIRGFLVDTENGSKAMRCFGGPLRLLSFEGCCCFPVVMSSPCLLLVKIYENLTWILQEEPVPLSSTTLKGSGMEAISETLGF